MDQREASQAFGFRSAWRTRIATRNDGVMTYVPLVVPGVGRSDEHRWAWHLRGVVRTTPTGPVVQVRGRDYPMPRGTPYAAGSELRLKLVFTAEEWQLQIVGPAGATTAPGIAEGLPELRADALLRVLTQLNLHASPEALLRLLPAHIPHRGDAVSTLVGRLASAEGAGTHLAQVVQVLLDASLRLSSLPPSAAAVVGWLVGPSRDPARWKEYLRRSRGGAPEALLARGLEGTGVSAVDEAALRETPEFVWSELADDVELASFVAKTGRTAKWRHALYELAARTDGDRLVELHALRAPYRLIELPMNPESGWRRAQLHLLVLPDQAVSAVVDVCTERLGAVWMALTYRPGQGSLRVRAERGVAQRVFERDRGDLLSSLADAGYAGVAIGIEPWDGDRLMAATEIFAPYRSVEVIA